MKTNQLHGIASLLIKNHILHEAQVIEYQQLAHACNQTLLYYLSLHVNVECAVIASMIANHFGLPLFDLYSLNHQVLRSDILTKDLIAQYNTVPIFIRGNRLFLATDDPGQYLALQNIQFHTELLCQWVIVETNKLHHYITDLLHAKDNQELINNEDVFIVKFIDNILIKAIKSKASDIHFESYDQYYRIRYRIDGILIEMTTPPHNVAQRITARIKILANLDPTERRLPQDGRFKTNFADIDAIDIRVSTCPTIVGETVVLRLLANHNSVYDISKLGLNAVQEQVFTLGLKKPYGMIIITGPTGSGKTITLYTALNFLNSSQSNLITIEDPVEIKFPGMNQVQVNNKIGLTFAHILKSLLRQDPDIIMLGEIRDLESATLAIQAAQTGHLVLTTLHANSAVDTINRLTAIGIPYFNIAHSVLMIIAQRLVRKLCVYCKSEHAGSFYAHGCPKCHYGYTGRIGLFEIMQISIKIQQLIATKAPSLAILTQAKQEKMLTLYQSGLEKVHQGVTSIDEISRVTSL